MDELQNELTACALRLSHMLDQNAGRTVLLTDLLVEHERQIGDVAERLLKSDEPREFRAEEQHSIGVCLMALCSILMEKKASLVISRITNVLE